MNIQATSYEVLAPGENRKLVSVGTATPTRKGDGLKLTFAPQGDGDNGQVFYVLPARAKQAPDAKADDGFDRPFMNDHERFKAGNGQ